MSVDRFEVHSPVDAIHRDSDSTCLLPYGEYTITEHDIDAPCDTFTCVADDSTVYYVQTSVLEDLGYI